MICKYIEYTDIALQHLGKNIILPGGPGGPSTNKVVVDDISPTTLCTKHLYSPESSNVILRMYNSPPFMLFNIKLLIIFYT